jgi:hypothetical protein
MTFDERVGALARFGFSERQTRFLVTVALHSGFCLPRHYATFAGLEYGQGVRDFLDRLVRRRLASRLTFRRDRGHVYHLHASVLYAAIGQDDNRNRRATSPALIGRKLMLLDYVLGQPGTEWYATEPDKVALFTTRFRVPPGDLPHRHYQAKGHGGGTTTRYFIHKLPIATTGDRALVSFVFLVTDTTGRGLTQFLNDQLQLLSRLSEWRIVAVCPRHLHGLPACEMAFRAFAHPGSQRGALSDVVALGQYFRARDVEERGDITRLSVADIDALRLARRRFAGPVVERLYRQWQNHDRSWRTT